jgi:hypothetical protein
MDNEPAPSFDRATYAPGVAAGPNCAKCQAAIRERYWRLNNQLFCESCRAQVSAIVANALAQASFGKAALWGGAVALACGIAYAIFVQATGMQLALVTIAIAYAVAKVVRRASGGLSGRRFQILAVLLTYVASAMGYAGPVLHGLSAAAPKADGSAAGEKQAATDSATNKTDDHSRPGAGFMVLGLLFLFGIVLAAPVLAATQAPIGLVIVGIGLYEAWKLSRPVAIVLDGPYNISGGGAPTT